MDPLPVPAGEPPAHRLCAERTPPLGLPFVGARATLGGYLLPCPSCVQGWALLVPDGQPYGYSISLEHGCSRGCSGTEVAWWHAWRSMELPLAPAAVPSDRARRYATAAVKGELRRLLERRPSDPASGLRAVAYTAGRLLAAGGLDEETVLRGLLRVAAGLGADPATLQAPIARALAAGQAQPRGVPA